MKTMTRGKQQILYNYLPGKTFDFERGPISRVLSIRGYPQQELNDGIVIKKIASAARAWSAAFRPGLGDHLLDDPSKFVLLDPIEVDAEIYPKVFWCQNKRCGRTIDSSNSETLPSGSCPTCKIGTLKQIRWVKVHQCGAIEPLTPPQCPKCHNRTVGLNTRDSERISAFRWVCQKCNHPFPLFAGYCQHCEWPDPQERVMKIEVHRAGRTYFPQTAVLLNIPKNELEGLLNNPRWPCAVGAKFLSLPSVRKSRLSDFFVAVDGRHTISTSDIDKILASGVSPEKAIELLREIRNSASQYPTQHADEICKELVDSTGVEINVWRNGAADLLEAIVPYESDQPPELLSSSASLAADFAAANRMGIADIGLSSDYTVVNATYGYTRGDYRPGHSWLNPFPADRGNRGRLPIYVDRVQADALLIRLDHQKMLRWLQANNIQVTLPAGSDPEASARAFFVQLFDQGVPLYTVGTDEPVLRMVFGLIHTLSHVCVRQASLLCGLERTSLSEYVIPRALTIAIYCNHRFGSTIGALTALFEQSLGQWLASVRDARTCVYDPICHDDAGSCHACTHLSETSCRFFNLNLSRSFLFGGPDPVLRHIAQGYFSAP